MEVLPGPVPVTSDPAMTPQRLTPGESGLTTPPYSRSHLHLWLTPTVTASQSRERVFAHFPSLRYNTRRQGAGGDGAGERVELPPRYERRLRRSVSMATSGSPRTLVASSVSTPSSTRSETIPDTSRKAGSPPASPGKVTTSSSRASIPDEDASRDEEEAEENNNVVRRKKPLITECSVPGEEPRSATQHDGKTEEEDEGEKVIAEVPPETTVLTKAAEARSREEDIGTALCWLRQEIVLMKRQREVLWIGLETVLNWIARIV
ncbi:PREDICTED: uncharacterized protein LOC106812500 [Priapulus caudatus]|uniref:Uncharacterized protein LOC106812500 n=1 Tax=Priapulus caudatus TaxID=37621 RepID=A0ABM1EI53_PRICU|nr:PREDICTED: uncharacterized protein LOC106812500 [Priapulus caudatus]